MIGKYLTDIGVKKGDTPQTFFHDENDSREPAWKKEREIYGFDNRETWSLDNTFAMWIYERLMMYKKVNIVDTDYHKYKFKDKEITFTECIEIMLKGFKLKITNGYALTEEEYEIVDDAFKVFSICHNSLWW